MSKPANHSLTRLLLVVGAGHVLVEGGDPSTVYVNRFSGHYVYLNPATLHMREGERACDRGPVLVQCQLSEAVPTEPAIIACSDCPFPRQTYLDV